MAPKLSTTEFNSLHDFYNATNGPFWRWHNVSVQSTHWNFSIHGVNPCLDDWQGLVCNCGLKSCTVNVLFLDHHNLTGHLPDSMENFSKMSQLILRGNNITGTITRSIGNMTELEVLDLSYNRLYGEIPSSIGRLSKLRSLNLGVNRLTKIPEELYELRSLQAFSLILNRVRNPISSRLGSLTKLITLQLQGNGIKGPIPGSIGNLQSLVTLDLGDNNFQSPLPQGFYRLFNLTSCAITKTSLTGTISPLIGQMRRLRTLELSRNELSLKIPAEIGLLNRLETLLLNENRFTGTLPQLISNLTQLKVISLQENQLFGKIDFLGKMNLSGIYFHQNLFTGNYMISPTQFQSIIDIDLSKNSLSGVLPWREDIEAPLLGLYETYLNFFTGTIPQIMKTPHLVYYVLGQNLVTGFIPETFFINITTLFYLSLNNNYMMNTIPRSISNCKNLNQIYLNGNYLSGSIPGALGVIDGLAVLDLDENLLSGALTRNVTSFRFLEELMIQNNLLTGTLDALLNSTRLRLLSNVDVSGNLFTGTLSSVIFVNSLQLTSFAAGSNCLKGSIPSNICEAKTMVSLTLDGLTTAENCRKYLFSGLSTQFTGFVAIRFLRSTIPTCLFEMPNIQLLHLSGNGLSGTIPTQLNISASLKDLALSYNSLEGTIPDVIQRREWNSLDLSYNKFTGTLVDDFVSIVSSGELSLQVNRLSGKIPPNVLATVNVSVLDGNIFQCDTLERDLPRNDPNYNKYTCGSDSANDVLYAWLSALIVVPLVALIVWRAMSQLKESFGELGMKIKVWRNALRSDDPKKINILRLSLYFGEVRKAAAILSIYSFVVLIPIYSSLTIYSATYTYQYAWTISAMLVTGLSASVVLFVSLSVMLWLFFTLIQRVLSNIDRKAPKAVFPKSEDLERSSQDREQSSIDDPPYHPCSTYIVVALINVLVMGITDFSYVYIILNYSTVIVSLTAFALALFRLGTNHFILWEALPLTSRWLSKLRRFICSCWGGTSDEKMDGVFDHPKIHYSTRDVHFIENIILFNNIIIPGLAIIFVLPDCFYNALFAAASVSSSYTYITCKQFVSPLGAGHSCTPKQKNILYDPPYLYSFQCSSKIVINYVPVYVILFLLVGILIPYAKVGAKLI